MSTDTRERIAHPCGHAWEHTPPQNPKKRKGWLAQVRSQPCPRCKLHKYHDEAIEEGLPEMRGSVSPACWAHEIRRSLFTRVEDAYKITRDKLKAEGKLDEATAHWLKRSLRSIANIDEAQWWIDRRTSDPQVLLREQWIRLKERAKMRER